MNKLVMHSGQYASPEPQLDVSEHSKVTLSVLTGT